MEGSHRSMILRRGAAGVLSYLPGESAVTDHTGCTWEALFSQVWVRRVARRWVAHSFRLRAAFVIAWLGVNLVAGFKGHLHPRCQCPESSLIA